MSTYNIQITFTVNAINEIFAKECALDRCTDIDYLADNISISEDIEILKCKGYVIASKYREKIIEALHTSMYGLTPVEIAEECNLKTNHISKVLSELVDAGLIECINPEMRKGKIYMLTWKGDKIQELI